MEATIDAYRNVHMSEGEIRWDENYNTINFTVNRFNEDNIDLTNYSCYIYFINTKGTLNKISVETMLIEPTVLFFQWDVSTDYLLNNGILKFQVSFENSNYMWQSHVQIIGINNNNIKIIKEGELYWPKTLK